MRAQLVMHYDNLALSLARRFPSRRESREDLTQLEIGRRIGGSQMYVSRTLTKTLARMRVTASRQRSPA